MTTGIVYSPECLTYTAPPDTPDRVFRTVEYFRSHGVDEFITPREYDEKYIRAVHTAGYMDRVGTVCKVMATGLECAHIRLSVDSCLTAGELVSEGELDNAFVLCRPPGHHAYADAGGGFCYYNNAAVLARYLQKEGFHKVMIVDWDAHHGNGTEAVFYGDPSVLYASVHQSPLYPGTGEMTDTGSGPGEGYTVNVPVPSGTGHDTYMAIFREVLVPIGKSFHPDALIISAGQDSQKDDPVAQLRLCPVSYHLMTERLVQDVCPRTIAVLEGGYQPENNAPAHLAIVSALMGKTNYDTPEFNVEPDHARTAVRQVKEVQAEYW
jgi:acetoin utilization deacetylase AcuC-like enzyme